MSLNPAQVGPDVPVPTTIYTVYNPSGTAMAANQVVALNLDLATINSVAASLSPTTDTGWLTQYPFSRVAVVSALNAFGILGVVQTGGIPAGGSGKVMVQGLATCVVGASTTIVGKPVGLILADAGGGITLSTTVGSLDLLVSATASLGTAGPIINCGIALTAAATGATFTCLFDGYAYRNTIFRAAS